MAPTIAGSASKVTSSSAPRKHLLDLSSPTSSAKRHHDQNVPEECCAPVTRRQLVTGLPWTNAGVQQPLASDFCFICFNGCKILVACDSCSATFCTTCIDFKLTAKQFENIYYFCHRCHELEEQKARSRPRPYIGLYEKAHDNEGKLVRGAPFRRKAFLRIVGLPSGVTTRRIVAKPLAIVHLHLSSCVTTSTDFCSSIVNPFFQSKELSGLLSIHDIEFNMSTKGGLQAYRAAILRVTDVLKGLGPAIEGRRALIMISTHSDEERGDLFLENNGAYTHQDFFSAIIPPAFAAALAAFDTTFLFLVCGAFVNVPQSLIDLRGMIAKYRFANVITFTSRLLQPDLVKPFLLHLLQQRFIYGYDLPRAIERILSESPHEFRRHTGVVHLGYNKDLDQNSSTSPVFATHYMWHSHTIMPWGTLIPIQCPKCFCIRQWEFPRSIPDINEDIVVKCKGWVWIDDEVTNKSKGKSKSKKKSKKKSKGRGKTEIAVLQEQLEEEANDQPSRPCTYTIKCSPPSRPFHFVSLPPPHVQGRWIVAGG
ncbi:hypothetical protein DENSPDRAFT_883730 [Dentipellis sp. KUC8613]|nr:hypothetical protein DENSPDRAFT_883730 [Dentipellis sp. KUC8613]